MLENVAGWLKTSCFKRPQTGGPKKDPGRATAGDLCGNPPDRTYGPCGGRFLFWCFLLGSQWCLRLRFWYPNISPQNAPRPLPNSAIPNKGQKTILFLRFKIGGVGWSPTQMSMQCEASFWTSSLKDLYAISPDWQIRFRKICIYTDDWTKTLQIEKIHAHEGGGLRAVFAQTKGSIKNKKFGGGQNLSSRTDLSLISHKTGCVQKSSIGFLPFFQVPKILFAFMDTTSPPRRTEE